MRKSQFISRLKRAVVWDQTPKLTDEDIDALVELSRTSDENGNYVDGLDEWEPGTLYEAGQMVVTPAGETFSCVVDGISGSLAPTSSSLVDGSVEWVYQGKTRYRPTFNFNRAAHEGWGLKAARAASMVSFTSDGARFDRDQYIKNCERMQEKYPQYASVRTQRTGVRVQPMILEVKVYE